VKFYWLPRFIARWLSSGFIDLLLSGFFHSFSFLSCLFFRSCCAYHLFRVLPNGWQPCDCHRQLRICCDLANHVDRQHNVAPFVISSWRQFLKFTKHYQLSNHAVQSKNICTLWPSRCRLAMISSSFMGSDKPCLIVGSWVKVTL